MGCTQREAIRRRIMSVGVRRETTRLMGTRASRRAAWLAVRGNPSRMKDAEGAPDGCAGGGSVIEDEEGEGEGEGVGSHFLA